MIAVSACLAGVECRYNGKAFPVEEVMELYRQGKALPVCPEMLAGFSAPRHPGEIRNGRVFSSSGDDETEGYMRGAKIALAVVLAAGCTKAVLKSKSPTCGSGRIYDGTFTGRMTDGDGVFASLLKQNGITVITEDDIKGKLLSD